MAVKSAIRPIRAVKHLQKRLEMVLNAGHGVDELKELEEKHTLALKLTMAVDMDDNRAQIRRVNLPSTFLKGKIVSRGSHSINHVAHVPRLAYIPGR